LFISGDELNVTSELLIINALKDPTRATYNSAQRRYFKFCNQFQFCPLPATEETLLGFVAFLYREGLKGTSIQVYLASIKSLHAHCGLIYPIVTPKLNLAVRGAKVLSSPPVRKLPITFSVLCRIFGVLSYHCDELLIKLAMAVAFFSCLRAGEVCVPDNMVFDAKKHLCVSDLSFFHDERMFSLLIKQSKTDKFSDGVLVYIGCSQHVICAYCLMVRYMKRRSSVDQAAPLFADRRANVLHKSCLVSATRLSLSAIGLNPALYSGHSFHAGSATTGADCGFNQWELKMLGRWSSECYNRYLRNPKLVSSFAKRLATCLD
jgi:hypothetical protein